jgi:hypothetical protein
MASGTQVAFVATLIGATVIVMTAGTARTVESHEGHGGPPGHRHDVLISGGLPGQERAQDERQQGFMEQQQSGRSETRQPSEHQGGADTQRGVQSQQQGPTGASGSLGGGGGSQPNAGGSGGSIAAGGGMGGR